MEDDIELKPNKKTVSGVLFTEKPDGQVPYVVILKRIRDKELNPNDYIFYDDEHVAWVWSDECSCLESLEKDYYFGDTKSSKYLTEEFDDLELIDLCLTLIPKENEKESPKYLAKQNIIKELEEKYMDLNMEIDNCQGCMDGLEEAFEELALYKDLVKYLGGDIDAHIQELTDNWFKKAKAQQKEKELEQQKEDEVIKKLPLDLLGLVSLNNKTVMNTFIKQNDKINEICDLLIRKFK